MKKQLISGLFIRLVSTSALAQSSFAGFYGQIATGYQGNQLGSISGSATITPNAGSDTRHTAPSQNFGSAPLVFGLGHYWQASDKWLIGLGADYSALKQTSPSFSLSDANAPGNSAIPNGQSMSYGDTNIQLSQLFNIFLTPAYAVDKDKLVYIKAGYSQVNAQYNRSTSITKTLNGTSTTIAATGGNQSSNQGGYILGLGYKQMISTGFYGYVEGNYMGYNSPSYTFTSVNANGKIQGIDPGATRVVTSNVSSLSAYQFLIGLGYMF